MEEKGGTKKRENQYGGMIRYETPKDGTRMSNTPDLWLAQNEKRKKSEREKEMWKVKKLLETRRQTTKKKS